MNSATIPTEKSSKVERYKAYQRYKQSQKKEQSLKNKTPLKMSLLKKRLSLIQENNKEIDNADFYCFHRNFLIIAILDKHNLDNITQI